MFLNAKVAGKSSMNENKKISYTVDIGQESERDLRNLCDGYFPNLGYSRVDSTYDTVVYEAGSELFDSAIGIADPKRRVVVCLYDNTLKCDMETQMYFKSTGGAVLHIDEIRIGREFLKIAERDFYGFIGYVRNEETVGVRRGKNGLKKLFYAVASVAAIVVLILGRYFGEGISRYIIASYEETAGIERVSGSAAVVREGLADVYLLPVNGFDEGLAAGLAQKLSQDLGINVRVSCAIPLPPDSFDANREQYVADNFIIDILNAKQRLEPPQDKTSYIALVHGSIYIKNTPFRFVFACHFDGKHSVIGNMEMREGGFAPDLIYHTRLYKMVKRTIGKNYYGLQPTSDPKSIMSSPVQSVLDIDRMGLEY